MMFGRRNHLKELRSEFAGLLREAQAKLGQEQADLIRAEYNVIHHRQQIERYKLAISQYEASLAEAERIMRERESGKAAAAGNAGQRDGTVGGPPRRSRAQAYRDALGLGDEAGDLQNNHLASVSG